MDNEFSNLLSIGFYNVENLFDPINDPKTADNDFTPTGRLKWDYKRYQNKLKAIDSAILSISPNNPIAIIGLAEVENRDVIEQLLDQGELGKFNYKIIHQNSPDTRGIDVAAIYRADLFTVDKYEFIPVEIPLPAKTREIVYIEGRFQNNIKTHIFFNHWPSRRKGTKSTNKKRIIAAKTLRTKVDEILEIDANANIFILGDFNDEPSDSSMKEHLLKTDLHNLSQQFEKTKIGTVKHHGRWLVFDQIIISKHLLDESEFNISENDIHIHNHPNLTFTLQDGKKMPNSTYNRLKYYGGYSDHYPVYINLTINI